jgi:hypothetical protein
MKRSRRVTALGLTLLLAVSTVGAAQGDGDLRRLAERLVGTWGAPGEMRVALHVGELPEDAMVDVPLPEEFALVGSLVRYERDAMVALQVVLDGPAATAEAFTALRAAFASGGWTVFSDEDTHGGGFVPTMPTLFGRACAPPTESGVRAVAFVNVSPLEGAASDVRIDVTPEAWEGACAPAHAPDVDRFAPLPSLAAPAGGRITAPIVSHDLADATALAVLRGGGELQEIVEHYEAELETAGWSALPGAAVSEFGTRSPWSLVDRTGRPWIGVLVVDRPTRTGPVLLSFAVVAEPGP